MDKPVSKTEYEMLAAFRYALRQFLRFSERAARKIGLTPQQHQALLSIKGFPGRDYIAIGELAERLQIRSHSTVGLVNRLESQGLVGREPATVDRRQVYISLTPYGAEVLEQLSVAHREELRRIKSQLGLLLEALAGVDEISPPPQQKPDT
jgi:DNA-binding MarR family transcriptional regulator